MGVSRCDVSYVDLSGTRHTVEVDAESLNEAVVLAVAAFRTDVLTEDEPGPMTEFTVSVKPQPVTHTIRLQSVLRWLEPSTRGGPGAAIRKKRLRELLGQK